MRISKSRVLRWSCLFASALLAVAMAAGLWLLRHKPPRYMMKDIRAGLAARHIADPDARLRKYLEERYGSMSDPAHRQEAFLDFFNLDHIKSLQFLVKHAPAERRQDSIDAMARWLADYRASLTTEDRAALNAQFQTPEGQVMLKRATAQYNSQDVHYRGNTVAVISQLLRTIHEVEQP
jgi:hypothetical protein